MSFFERAVEKCGWTPVSQVEILLEYIENQQSDDAFSDFISQKCDEHGPETLGLSQSLVALEVNAELNLFKCLVGVCSADSDVPAFEYEVFVASLNVDDAIEASVCEVEKAYSFMHKGMVFSSEDEPELLDPALLTNE